MTIKKNAMIVIPGNCRTFIDCFDSCYSHIISKLFLEDEYNIYIYLYLKLTDPGPKDQEGWNFTYKDTNKEILVNKIMDIQNNYKNINLEYTILLSDEISDKELLLQVKDRTKYIEFFNHDGHLIRALHQHYNFECCGKYITEKYLQNTFDYYIYIRPDLYFTHDCEPITNYSNELVTCDGQHCGRDYIAIIPKQHFTKFFYDRMEKFRNNTEINFNISECIFFHTIPHIFKNIGNYYIKRE